MQHPQASRAPSPSRRPPVLALIAISALSPFSINALVPSLPAIEHAFSASYGRVQLVLSLYLASIAVSQILIGPLSDRYGRRPVLLGGFVIFIAASIAAPFAPTLDALIGLRIVQAAGGCVGIVLGRAIVGDLFERQQAASQLGYVTMGLAMAPMVAPTIGGVLQEFFDWTAIFWFMTALGVVCLAVAWWAIPETNLRRTSSISLGTLFADFARLLRSREFVLFMVSAGLTSGVFFVFLGGAPYVAERILMLTPSVYGLWFGLIAIGYASGSFVTARFAPRVGVARMILIGCVVDLLAVAVPILAFASGRGGAAILFIPMMVMGFANGLALPTAVSGAISARPEIAGAASGLSGAFQLGMGAVLSVVAGAALAGGTSAMPMLLIMMGVALLALLVGIILMRQKLR